MHAAFNLRSLDLSRTSQSSFYYSIGKRSRDNQSQLIEKSINQYINPKGEFVVVK